MFLLLQVLFALLSVTLLPRLHHSGLEEGKVGERDELEELLLEYDDGPELLSENETFFNITTDAPTEMPFLVIDVNKFKENCYHFYVCVF